jgi:hypothetical protein
MRARIKCLIDAPIVCESTAISKASISATASGVYKGARSALIYNAYCGLRTFTLSIHVLFEIAAMHAT